MLTIKMRHYISIFFRLASIGKNYNNVRKAFPGFDLFLPRF